MRRERRSHNAAEFVWRRPHTVTRSRPQWATKRIERKNWSHCQDKPPLATRGMVVLLGLDAYGTAGEYVNAWECQGGELLRMSMGEVFERLALQYQALTGASRESYMEFCQTHFPRTWAGLHPDRSSPEFRPLPEEASFAV